MLDPTGTVITRTRDDPSIAAITNRVVGDEPNATWKAPMVVIVRQGTSRSPAGRQRDTRAGIQLGRYAARCYGTTYSQATQLSGAVSDLWHNRGPFVGNGGIQFLHTYADVIAGPVLDPALKTPFETVYIEAIAGAYPSGTAVTGQLPSTPGDSSYVHHQTPAASVWTIVHNLGKYPAVETSDLARNEIYGDVDWVDLNTVTVTFAGAVDGYAYLN